MILGSAFYYNMFVTIIIFLMQFYIEMVDAGKPDDYIDWKVYDAKHLKPSIREYYKCAMDARIRVPQRHGDATRNENDSVPAFDLYVRKFSRSARRTRRHLWLISGGPGSSTSGIERALNLQISDTTIYIMDSRGLGHSHKMCHHSMSRECQQNPVKCYNALEYDPKVISIHETAKDYNYVSRLISRMNGGGDNEFYMYGSSYGAILAYAAFKYDPTFYSGLLLEAFMPDFRLNEKIDIRRHVIDSCFSSVTCRKSFETKSTRQEAENLMEVAMRKDNRNACKESMEFLAKHHSQQLNALLNSYARVAFYKRTGLRTAFIPLLFGVTHCPNFEEFKVLIRQFHGAYQSYNNESKTEIYSECHCSSPSNTNHFFGGHIRFSEYAYEADEKMQQCMTRGYLNPANWADVCGMVSDFKEEYRPFLYEPEVPIVPLKKLERSTTRLVITTGKLDTQTPHDAAEREFDKLPLNEKYLFAADHAGHGTIDSWEVPGLKLELMLSFLMSGSESDLSMIRTAIKSHNDQPDRIWRNWDRKVFGDRNIWRSMESTEGNVDRVYDWRKFMMMTGVAFLVPLLTLLINTILEDDEEE